MSEIRFTPRLVIHPTPRILGRAVIEPTPAIQPRPYVDPLPLDTRPVKPTADSAPSKPSQPFLLPLEEPHRESYPVPKTTKQTAKVVDIRSGLGRLVDVFA
jgi:hypothetical protein